MTSARNDAGGVIVGYFTKIALVLSVFAVVSFDAVSVGVAKMSAEDNAQEAARAGAESWSNRHDEAAAYTAAVRAAAEHDAEIDPTSFAIAEDGTVTVTLTKEATTLLIYRVKKTQKWAVVSATASGRTV